ncbi:MAG: hypothetical protein HY013_21765 [Candidatus Solibacter usitatus]|nr:hypothetical protein [Candidatus Solibacter usitatus]
MSRHQIVDFNQVAAVPCPCGVARRAFSEVADFPATVHLTEISADAWIELDGDLAPVRPGLCVQIPPGEWFA